MSWQAQHFVKHFVAGTALCEPRSADFVTGTALCEPRSADFVAGTNLEVYFEAAGFTNVLSVLH